MNHRKSAHTALTAVVIAAALALTACTSSGSQQPKGELDAAVIAMPGRLTQFDPLNTILQQNVWLMHLTGGTLFSFVPGTIEDVEPALAESATIADDAMSATVELKPDLTFSDGSPLTSDIVVANYRRALEGPSIGALFFGGIADVSAISETTIEFTFSRPNPEVLTQLANFPFTILPDGAWADEGFAEAPVTSGPYKYEGSATGDTVTLVRNESYVGPTPSLETLEFRVIGDTTSAANQLQAGQIDFASDVPPERAASLGEEVVVDTVEAWGVQILTPNPSHPVLADPAVREAIALAIDREQIAELATSNVSAPLVSPIGSNFPPTDGDAPYPSTADVAGAKAALVGSTCATGCSFNLLTNTSWSTSSKAAVIIQQQLAEIGIDVSIETVDQSTYDERAFSGNFELLMTRGGAFGYGPALILLLNPQGPTMAMFSQWGDPAAPAAIDAAASASAEEQGAVLADLEALFRTSTPWVPLVTDPADWAVSSAADGLVFFSPTGLLDIKPAS